MHVLETPLEDFPELGSVSNPALMYDGKDTYICYEASVRAGRGNVVLKFSDVIDFRLTPLNVEGLSKCRYPVKPWMFNEILDCEEIDKWKQYSPRLWLISFNDVMVEVLFEQVILVGRELTRATQHETLIRHLSA